MRAWTGEREFRPARRVPRANVHQGRAPCSVCGLVQFVLATARRVRVAFQPRRSGRQHIAAELGCCSDRVPPQAVRTRVRRGGLRERGALEEDVDRALAGRPRGTRYGRPSEQLRASAGIDPRFGEALVDEPVLRPVVRRAELYRLPPRASLPDRLQAWSTAPPARRRPTRPDTRRGTERARPSPRAHLPRPDPGPTAAAARCSAPRSSSTSAYAAARAACARRRSDGAAAW